MTPSRYIAYTSAAQRYDASRRRNKDGRLPPGFPRPQPTACWPPENVALLEEYRLWLLEGGASPEVTDRLYLVMAGNVLGLALKPHPQLELKSDLDNALAYVEAKQLSPSWRRLCGLAVQRFRRFLHQRRGLPDPLLPTLDLRRRQEGLPDWFVQQLSRYQRVQERNWRPHHREQSVLRFWSSHSRLWRWLFARSPQALPTHIRRQELLDYVDARLAAGGAVSGINTDLRNFRSFLFFLQEQGFAIPPALLRPLALKPPDPLPKFLTDPEVLRLQREIDAGVQQAHTPHARRLALLERACFYLLWHGGLRKGEVEALALADLDLAGRRLTVRQGKGLHERTVYLTDTAVAALTAWLPWRGPAPTEHLFTYRNLPLSKDLIHGRLKAAGARAGVKLSAHRLRHTCATQLLNAGCRVTSIQKFLGHQRLSTTMTYARVHDQTVADDFYAAMQTIEGQMALLAPPLPPAEPPSPQADDSQLLALTRRLAVPRLSDPERLALVNRLWALLVAEAGPVGPDLDRPADDSPTEVCYTTPHLGGG